MLLVRWNELKLSINKLIRNSLKRELEQIGSMRGRISGVLAFCLLSATTRTSRLYYVYPSIYFLQKMRSLSNTLRSKFYFANKT